MTYLRCRQFRQKVLMHWIQVVIWAIGAIMKCVIFKSFKKIFERPINILIILGQVLDFVPNTFIVANVLMMIPYSSSSVQFLDQYFGLKVNTNNYCWFYYYLSVFWTAYTNCSSLGIAIFRYILIRKSVLVRQRKKIKALLILIILGGIFTSTMTSFVTGKGVATSRLVYNGCFGISEKFQVSFLLAKHCYILATLVLQSKEGLNIVTEEREFWSTNDRKRRVQIPTLNTRLIIFIVVKILPLIELTDPTVKNLWMDHLLK